MQWPVAAVNCLVHRPRSSWLASCYSSPHDRNNWKAARAPPHLGHTNPAGGVSAPVLRAACASGRSGGDVVAANGSIQFRRDSATLVANALPATIQLAGAAVLIAAVLGVGGGLIMFRLRDTVFEPLADMVSIVLLSIPDFLWGLILLFVFGVTLHFLPFTGQVSPGLPAPRMTGFLLLDSLVAGRFDVLWSACQHLILPAAALGLAFSPTIMRVLRSSLFDVYHEDYIQQARLRGLSEKRILLGHALKNASLPTLTLAGVQFGILFSGTLLVEVIYSYPGMGNLMVDAVRNADLPLIQAIGLTYCIVVLIINTVVDSLYVVLNPKLRVR
jgi:peptide/nickel transport system permease protein